MRIKAKNRLDDRIRLAEIGVGQCVVECGAFFMKTYDPFNCAYHVLNLRTGRFEKYYEEARVQPVKMVAVEQ